MGRRRRGDPSGGAPDGAVRRSLPCQRAWRGLVGREVSGGTYGGGGDGQVPVSGRLARRSRQSEIETAPTIAHVHRTQHAEPREGRTRVEAVYGKKLSLLVQRQVCTSFYKV